MALSQSDVAFCRRACHRSGHHQHEKRHEKGNTVEKGMELAIEKMFKYEVNQYMQSLQVPTAAEPTKEIKKQIEELLMTQRCSKRLKLQHTVDGNNF